MPAPFVDVVSYRGTDRKAPDYQGAPFHLAFLTTEELARELGISDLAVTERLRRPIPTPVANTLAVADEDP